MALSSESMRAFFDFHLPPRKIERAAKIDAARLGDIRRGAKPPTAHEIALLAIAFDVPYDDIWKEFEVIAKRRLALVKQPARA